MMRWAELQNSNKCLAPKLWALDVQKTNKYIRNSVKNPMTYKNFKYV